MTGERYPGDDFNLEGLMTARRELTFLLAPVERRVLTGIARRLPQRLTSDHLTALGLVGSLGTGLAYALSATATGWLWVATGMIAINWLGDSLDGTLARVRRTERPKYGYYLDHLVDALSTAAVGVGIGLSPYVDLAVGLVLVIAYLSLSINVYLESAVFGVFRLAYGRIGPTETRVLLILANTILALASWVTDLPPERVGLFTNLAALGLAGGMLAVLVARFASNLRVLGRMEPMPPGPQA